MPPNPPLPAAPTVAVPLASVVWYSPSACRSSYADLSRVGQRRFDQQPAFRWCTVAVTVPSEPMVKPVHVPAPLPSAVAPDTAEASSTWLMVGVPAAPSRFQQQVQIALAPSVSGPSLLKFNGIELKCLRPRFQRDILRRVGALRHADQVAVLRQSLTCR